MAIPSFLRYWLARHPDIYERIARWAGRFSPERMVLFRLVRPGDVVLDVGANRGYFTAFFSHLVGPSGQVHAFEASPLTFRMLKENVEREQRFPNVKLNNAAAGDTAGSTTLFMPDQDDGQASLRQQQGGSWTDAQKVTTFECTMVRLDDYVAANVQRPVGFIKCDIEGAELIAFRGAAATLREQKPLIFCEVCAQWTTNFGYTPGDVVRFLAELGYDRFYVVDDNGSALLRPINSEEVDSLTGSHDLVCGYSANHTDRLQSSGLVR